MYEIIRIIFSVKADILQKSVEDKLRRKRKNILEFFFGERNKRNIEIFSSQIIE